jgi:tetratricopeptide (TPR) repeat protein
MHNRSRPPGVIWQPQDTVPSLSGRIVREGRRAEPLSADGWYDLGIDLEACAPDEAREAYCRALAMDSRHADAHVNLGRLLQEAGKRAEAAGHYRSALAAKPGHPIAAFNLGTALEELGRPAKAIEAYRRAVEANAEFADAHFNLSRLYERAGKRAAALRHLRTYKMLSEKYRTHDEGPRRHPRERLQGVEGKLLSEGAAGRRRAPVLRRPVTRPVGGMYEGGKNHENRDG